MHVVGVRYPYKPFRFVITRQEIQKVARCVLRQEKIQQAELAIILTNDAEMQQLNNTYRQQNKPTNVLSFPACDVTEYALFLEQKMPIPLGDVVLAYETIEREAKEQQKNIKDHTIHLLVHGMLHLLNYDHLEEEDAHCMEQREVAILAILGVQNPYHG